MSKLVLLRHGESLWNAEGRFTGWVDIDLSPTGEKEAEAAGAMVARTDDLDLQGVHTSMLTRAIRTAEIALHVAGLSYLPVRRHWRLNERHYGALQGLNKEETAQKAGAEQVHAWRRSYNTPPPAVDLDDPNHPIHDPRYLGIPRSVLPATECLADVVDRMVPYFEDAIAPDLLSGKNLIVVAHGNSLRALMKYLEQISDEDIAAVEIPTGTPRLYDLDEELGIRSVRYLS